MQLRHKTTGAVITVPENGSYKHLTSFEVIKPVSKSTETTASKPSAKTKATRKKAEVADGTGD